MRAILTIVFVVIFLAVGAIVLEQLKIVDLPLSKIPGLGGFDVVAEAETTEEENPVAEEPKEEPAPAPVAPPKEEPKVVTAPVEEPKETDPYALKYPFPNFKSIEELLNNWTSFPPSVFPRKVKLTAAVDREIRSSDGKVIGKSKVPPGSELMAMGNEGDKLRLATDPRSSAVSLVEMGSTDFQDGMRKQYEEYKERVKKQILAQRVAAKERDAQMAAAQASSGASGDSTAPTQPIAMTSLPSSDPRFQPMISSIKSGNFTELKLDKVSSWSWVGPMKVEGKTYDVGIVGFSSMTIFGEMPTEAMALIANNRVNKWLYTGSREEVQ